MDSFNIDRDRTRRLGFPEIIYGASKSPEVIVDILHNYRQRGENALVTKLQPEKGAFLLGHFPDAFFDGESGIFLLELDPVPESGGEVAIVAGGTSDLFVVNEVYYTLHYLGIPAERVVDVGVSGLHRLTDRLDQLRQFRILIVVAGFEAALASVVGGLLPQPIIAVPTSVGYGVAAGGKAALSSMLASCANGITVVNIDNGYGAAIAAVRILHILTPTP
mgnify:CR=1 FL=1